MQLNFHKINTVTFLATMVLLIVSINTSFAKDMAASVNDLSGYVTVTKTNGDVMRLGNNDGISDGDIVTTGANSSVSIVLPNGEQIQLGENDTYTIGATAENGGKGGAFVQRSLGTQGQSLSTATSAGGGITAPTTPDPGGSPSN